MQVNILAFAIARDIVGNSSFFVSLPENTTIADLKQYLIDRYPKFSKLANFNLAINNEYQEDDFLLRPSDEIALIPPVSGG